MLAAGQSIGNYRVISKIGTGGMGAVYLAEHPLIGKKVALKVIHRELASNRDVVQRFYQEARAVNKIGNEHIVEIHDFGMTPEGDNFYIMEYLEGETLAQVLARDKAIAPMRALHLGAQIASALAAAHASSVIHRDLKPDNIMLVSKLGDQDFVKVLDFGLAKIFSAASAVKTAAGVLLGTPQYMSPEACEGKSAVDHRTDIYALGILLFQMMTGKLPFDGQTMAEVLVKQVTQLPPAPRGLNPAIPPSVEQILLRCLAKHVDARFPTMAMLRDALLAPDAYLGASPPIQPARSVAPGEARVDAAMVMAHAAQHQARAQAQANDRTMIGVSASMAAQTGAASGGMALPLPAPAPTLMGAAAPDLRGRTGGMAAQPLPFANGDANGHGGRSAAMATVMADGAMVPGGSATATRRAQTAVPDMAPPEVPNMNTMRIATPVGYSSRPPRRIWPIVLSLGLTLGIGGGIIAVVLARQHRAAIAEARALGSDVGSAASTSPVPSAPPPGTGPGSSVAVVTPIIDAGSGPTVTPIFDAAPEPVAKKLPRISIDSTPAGADVWVNGVDLHKSTPTDVEMPVGSIALVLRLSGYKDQVRTLAVTGNTSLSIGLEKTEKVEKAPPPQQGTGTKPPPPQTPPPTGSSGNGLMRPGDD